MSRQKSNAAWRTIDTKVLVATGQKDLLEERMKVCNMLWGAGIEVCTTVCEYVSKTVIVLKQTELFYKKDPLFLNQVQYCEENLVPYMIIVGSEEMDKGGVKLRNVATREEVCPYVCKNLDMNQHFIRILSSMKPSLKKLKSI